MSELTEYTEKLEKLLEDQKAENKRIKKMQIIQSWAMVAFIAVFSIGIISLNVSVKRATAGVPELVETAKESVVEMSDEVQNLLEEINQVDFENLNKTIEDAGKSINELDIESLNNSVHSLETVVSKLAAFFKL